MSGKKKKQETPRSAESAFKGNTLFEDVKVVFFLKFKMLRDGSTQAFDQD